MPQPCVWGDMDIGILASQVRYAVPCYRSGPAAIRIDHIYPLVEAVLMMKSTVA